MGIRDLTITVKHPYDLYPYEYDFAALLVTAETIDTYTIKAYKIDDDTDVTTTVLGTTAKTSTTLQVIIKAGDLIETAGYRIEFKVVTSDANQYHEDVLMYVRKGPLT